VIEHLYILLWEFVCKILKMRIWDFLAQDAALWASWGVDFLKYDYCNAPSEQATAIERYTLRGSALENCGEENSIQHLRMGRTKSAPVGKASRWANVACDR